MKEYKVISGQLLFSYARQIVFFVMNLLLFVTLTRYLTKGDYGLVSLFFATITLSYTYLNLGLPQFILKELPGRTLKQQKAWLNQITTLQLLVLLVVFIFVAVLFEPIAAWFGLSGHRITLWMVIFTILVMTASSLHIFYQLAQQKIIISGSIQLIQASWMLAVSGYAYYTGSLDLVFIFASRLFFAGLVFVILWVILARNDGLKLVKLNKKQIRKALTFSLPLLPLFASEYFISAIDRYILGWYHGTSLVGSYSYYYSILGFILLFAAIPMAKLWPYASREFKKNKTKSNFFFNAGAKYSLMLLLPGLVGIYMLRYEIVTMLSGPKYVNDLFILPILLVYPLLEFLGVTYRKACLLRDRTKFLMWTYVSGGLINIVLNILLIPQYGMVGAAFATVVTYLFITFILYKEGCKLITWDNKFIQVHKIITSALVMGLILMFVSPQTVIMKVLAIFGGAVVYFACILLFKTFVKEEKELIKSFIYRRRG